MKKAKYLFKFIIVCTIILLFSSNSYSFQVVTHKNINEYIARNTMGDFSFSQYLIDKLGFPKGKDENFNDKKVYEWLREGGEMEDDPFTRSGNHFHNPLTNKGYSGIWGTGLFSGESSIAWSQLSGGQTPGGFYSWQDVRGYYYNALTRGQTTRDSYFAETFRGLGQLMHLVQDLSVPEHATRFF